MPKAKPQTNTKKTAARAGQTAKKQAKRGVSSPAEGAPAQSTQQPEKVGELLLRTLKETEHSPADLAEAVQVPPKYLDDLIAGRRMLPRQGRTDLYEGMTSFLKLGRNELLVCAEAERAQTKPKRGAGPGPKVRKELLALCEPGTAKKLERDRHKNGAARLTDLTQRLLDTTQRATRRRLADQISLRAAATKGNSTYVAMRFKVLEFLDTTAHTLTTRDVAEFVRPLIDFWDVDIEENVLRVVLRPHHS